ncbi:MAG TPA: cysteine synthase family protein [Chitinophagaceae bacterium]|nr:cysteine synthase family protein [Chitinophagaceae bacterium]
MTPLNGNILDTVGNTPMVKLQNIVPENCADIFVKLEYYNPTGSFKDRMAKAIIEQAEIRGDLRPGMTVLECTAGSTGTSLAFVCSLKGYPFKVISSDAFAREKLQAMRLFGADLDLFPSEGKGITPDLIPTMMGLVRDLSANENYYWTRQFENIDAFEGYRAMGKEILAQADKSPDVFCAAVGTAGMFAGVSLALKDAEPGIRVIALEPESSPLLSRGVKGSHKIDGIAVGFVPPLLSLAKYDQVQTVEESEARAMAKKLAKEEGIFAGTSTGLNVVGAIRIGKELGPGHSVVTVACDSGMKYMGTGLFD